MSCTLNRETIKSSIIREVGELLTSRIEGITMDENNPTTYKIDEEMANSSLTIIEEINNQFTEPVAGLTEDGNSIKIFAPESVINDYLPETQITLEQAQTIQDINNEFGREVVRYNSDGTVDVLSDNIPLSNIPRGQQREVYQSSEQATNWAKAFLNNVGVEFKKVSNIVVGGKLLNAEAVALPLQSLVLYTQDNGIQLTEEAMHVAVELLSAKSPEVYNSIMRDIEKTQLYDEVLNQYKGDKLYQNKDGSVNVTKIKKEAVAKALADKVVYRKEAYFKKADSWWGKIKEFIQELFGVTGEAYLDSYNALNTIMHTNLGNTRQTLLQNPTYLLGVGIPQGDINFVMETASNPNLSDQEVLTAISSLMPDIIYKRKQADEVLERLTKPSQTIGVNNAEKKFLTKALRGNPRMKNLEERILNRADTVAGRVVRDTIKKMISPEGKIDLTFQPTSAFERHLLLRLVDRDRDGIVKLDVPITNPKNGDSSIVDMMIITSNGQVNLYNFLEVGARGASNIDRRISRSLVDEQVKIIQAINPNTNFGQRRIIPVDTSNIGNPIIEHGVDRMSSREDLYPVFADTELSEDKDIRPVVAKLKTLLEQISNKSVKGESANRARRRAITSSSRLITELQLFTVNRIEELGKTVRRVNSKAVEFTEKLENLNKKPYEDIKDELTEILDEVTVHRSVLVDFVDTLAQIKKLHEQQRTSEYKKGIQQSDFLMSELNKAIANLDTQAFKLIDRQTTEEFGITKLQENEKIPGYITRMFRALSQQNPRTVRVLYNLTKNVWHTTDLANHKFVKELQQDKADFQEFMKSRKLTYKQAIGLFIKGDKHELIDRIKTEFYTKLDEEAQQGNIQWIKDNIDVAKYEAEVAKLRKDTYATIDSTLYSHDPAVNLTRQAEARQQFEERYNLNLMKPGFINPLARKYPLPKWETEEYRTLSRPENSVAKKVYDKMIDQNERLLETGAIQEYQRHTFLPFVRRTAIESLDFKSTRLLERTLGASLVRPDDDSLGKLDSKGEPKMQIPIYYTEDFSVIERDGTRGHEIMSRDIFNLMQLMETQINRFEAVSEIESTAEMLVVLENSKQKLATNTFGDRNLNAPNITSEITSQMLEDYMRMELYGHKYTDTQGNLKLGTYSNKWAKRINKFFGRKLITEEYDGRDFTAREILESLKQYQTIKLLGFNIPVSVASLFNNQFHAYVNSGEFIGKKELSKSVGMVFKGVMKNDKDKKAFAVANSLMPIMDSGNVDRQSKLLKMHKIDQYTIAELAMLNHRMTDYPVQMAIAIAHTYNHMIDDSSGKIVNIRQFVRNKPEYQDRHNTSLSQEQRKALREQMNQEIQDLIDTKSLVAISQVDSDGNIFIPGIDRYSKDIHGIRERIQQDSRNASGMGNAKDVRLYQGKFWLSQIMTYMSWLPRTVSSRISGLEHVEGTGTYEWGRWRVMQNLLFKSGLATIQEARNVILLNEKGIEFLQERYEEQKTRYELENPGKEFDIGENGFMELYQRQVQNTLYAVAGQLAIIGLSVFVMSMIKAGAENEERKGYWRYANRVMNKVQNELSFYYNPLAWKNLADRNFLPSLSALDDVALVIKDVALGGYNIAIDDMPEAESKFYKAGKTAIRAVPILRGLTPFMVFALDDEMREKTGINFRNEVDPWGQNHD